MWLIMLVSCINEYRVRLVRHWESIETNPLVRCYLVADKNFLESETNLKIVQTGVGEVSLCCCQTPFVCASVCVPLQM